MSVTFYDPENPTKYDDNYEIVGGGPEANFANSNARMIVEVLGLKSDPSIYGEISAQDLLAAIDRANVGIENFCDEDFYKTYLLRALESLKHVAQEAVKHSNKVCWG